MKQNFVSEISFQCVDMLYIVHNKMGKDGDKK